MQLTATALNILGVVGMAIRHIVSWGRNRMCMSGRVSHVHRSVWRVRAPVNLGMRMMWKAR
jgi:hypothetical protein